MKLPLYPKYKDSGVKWLGEVPEHWETWKIRHAFQIIGSGTTPRSESQEYYEEGEYPWLNSGDLRDSHIGTSTKKVTKQAFQEHSALKMYPSGSVAIAMYGATVGKLGILDFPATVNQACCVFSGSTVVDSKFLFYSLLGCRDTIMSYSVGGGQPNISQDILRQFKVPCPSHDEQIQIVHFLDIKAEKIDALIVEQQQLIELLKEKRQSVISNAVTKGLDSIVSLKDSGVKWLGQVPAHWDVYRLGTLFREIKDAGNDDFPILSVSIHDGVSDRQLDEDEMERKVNRSEDSSKYKKVDPADLVYNMMRAWQGGFGTVLVPGLVSPAYVVARPKKDFSTRFIELLLRTPQAIEEIRCHSHGVTDFRLRLYWDNFKIIRVALPPRPEQEKILTHIEKINDKFDKLIEAATISISTLQERRSALITAAVTGQIDVRNYRQQEAPAVCQ